MDSEEVRPFTKGEQRQKWQEVQESFARITGLSLWTIDDQGKIIGQPTSPPSLCLLLRKHRESRAICNKDCISNCQRAFRNNRTIFFRCHADFHCFAAPLRSTGRPMGIILGGQILTGSPDLEKYKELAHRCGLEDEELMKAIGDLSIGTEKMLRQSAEFIAVMAELVFSGWAARDDAGRRLSLLTNLFNISAEFSVQMNPHEIYALVLNSLAILFDIDSAAMLLLQPATGMIETRYAHGPQHRELMALSLSSENSFVERLFEEPAPLSTDEYHLLLRSGFPEKIKQATFFPLFSGEDLLGILAVFNHTLEKEEKKTIMYFANQASIYIESACLRKDVKEKMSILSAMGRLSQKFSGLLKMDDLLTAIFEEAAKMARAERSSLMVLDRKTSELVVKLVKGDKDQVLKNCTVPIDGSLAGQVARVGEPLLVKNLEKDQRIGRSNRPGYKTPSFVIIPLKAAGRIIGVLNIADKISGDIFSEEDLQILRSLALQATIALERSELYERTEELKKISITDPLTGLLNRRYFQERATEEIDRSMRYNQPFSLMMIDVDDFKRYNDQHGHLAGDDVLKDVGMIIKSMIRNIDVISRFGGEEFAILSPNTPKLKSLQISERIRKGIEEYIFAKEKGQPGGSLTISAGAATFPDDASSLEELINNADKALYASKKAGKNQSTLYRTTG